MRAARRTCTLLLSLGLLLAAPSARSGEDSQPIFRAISSEVRLTFYATDHNRNVSQLQRDDFAVVDDEWVVRDFRSFGHCNTENLELVILVDGSESVSPQYGREVAGLLRLLSQSRVTSADRVSVIAFSGLKPSLICGTTCQNSSTVPELLATRANGATPLFDAVVYASQFIATRPDPEVRPVLIIFSDGEDTVSIHTDRSAIQAALARELQIFSVDLNSSPSTGSAVLRDMAEVTGGRYFLFSDSANAVLSSIVDDLHNAYLVTYRLPSRRAGFHSVSVLPTHNLNFQFRSRRGYYYPRALE